MYDTTDRKRGPKGNKRNQTRTVGGRGYGNGDFCTLSCQDDWWKEHGTRAVDQAGRLHQPKVMTPENSWDKRSRTIIVGNEIMEKLSSTITICVQ